MTDLLWDGIGITILVICVASLMALWLDRR
jgi:hypothetical protein